MKKIAILLVVLLSFAILFGCTQTAPENNTNDNTNTTDNPTDNTTDNTNNNDDSVDDSTNNDLENDEVFDEFVATLSLIGNYSVTYNVTADTTSFEMTQIVKAGEMRTDTTMQGIESRVYLLTAGQYTCTNVMNNWMCYDLGEQAGASVSSGFEDVQDNTDAYKGLVTSAGTQTIIGQATTCYNIADTDYSYKYCLNAKGVPLLMEGTSGGATFKFEATAYSEDVSTTDFELPAEPQQLPGQ